jgi:hypothetical protein
MTTITLGWGVAAVVAGLVVLVFWLGRASAGGNRGRGDLSGVPSRKPRARPASSFGSGPAGLNSAQRMAIVDELARGNKIAAIKLMREATGVGLTEAKQAVEAMAG